MNLARVRALVRRPVVAAVLLLAAYGALSLWMDPQGTLGTDTGAKVATLEVMDRTGSAVPELGYWAQQWDPTGEVHPIFDVQPSGDDDWVHVTTLPMLELARPLYAVGGYRLTLLLPMLGAVGAAFAARSIARRAGDEAAGWSAYWLVGLASPIVVYALDFWEHAPGVACILGAVALLAGVLDGEPRAARALGAGALLGFAATMRTEAFVYTAVSVGACCVWLLVRDRRWGLPAQVGLLSVVGFGVPWVGNVVLEGVVGGRGRGARVAGAASGGLDGLGERLREVAITSVALRSAGFAEMILLGSVAVGALAIAVVAGRRGDRRLVLAGLAAAGVLHVAAVGAGLGFVPGLFAAAPLAVVAVAVPPHGTAARYAVLVAGLALPLVWSFQFVGGALPQWGARYALPSSILLVTAAVPRLGSLLPAARRGVVVLALLVSASGVAWLHERTHDVARLFDELVERPEDVVISTNGFFVREGGAAYLERRWLTADTPDKLTAAVEVVRSAGLSTFVVLTEVVEGPATLDGAVLQSTTPTSFLGVAQYLHAYRLPG